MRKRRGYKYHYNQRKGRTWQMAGRTPIPKESAIEGEWNVIDDRTGFKVKSSQTLLTWDGFLTSDDIAEPRTPQDFVRSVRDQKPLPSDMIRQEIVPPQFGSETEEGLIQSLLNR